jgi:ribosomal protein L37AE/L43A
MSAAALRYRIQFQKGLGLLDFQKQFGSESSCRAALQSLRWPDGYVCPRCGSASHWKLKRPLLRCAKCQHDTSLTAGTLFHCTKLPLTTWFLAIYFFTQTKTGISMPELKRHLQVNEKTACLIQHKLMETMRISEQSRVLKGAVELCGATLEKSPGSGNTGHPVIRKLPFVFAVQTDTDGGVSCACVQTVTSFRRSIIKRWAEHHLAAGTIVYTETPVGMTGVELPGIRLDRQKQSGSSEYRSGRYFWLRTLMGNLYSALKGVRHLELSRYAGRFLALFQFRLNHRFDLATIAHRLLHCAALTSPKPRRMILAVETHGKSRGRIPGIRSFAPLLHPGPA